MDIEPSSPSHDWGGRDDARGSTNLRIARAGRAPIAVSGQVDRLAVTRDAVLMADYKTDAAAPRELAAKRVSKKSFWNANPIPPAEDLTPAEFLQKEVDPILDKISERGIQSLTARERDSPSAPYVRWNS